MRLARLPFATALCLALLVSAAASAASRPNVVFVTVDTLRADRLSCYGYGRDTTPNLDRLLAGGVRFAEARTVEPLTNPALSSMLTSLYPHQHGSTRNGIPIHRGLPSLGRVLVRRGFTTAAFVGNWTLKREISGLDEHFETYQEVLTRKRWFFIKGEATARDLTEEALGWIDDHQEEKPDRPFLLWVHYVEPHAPYRQRNEMLGQLGFPDDADLQPRDRYDTEVAYVDAAIGRFLEGLYERSDPEDTLVVFAADHGESLGEHAYWGHGRNLYEESLRIPMGIVWPGHLEPEVVDSPASILDLTPTVLGLLAEEEPAGFRGLDWSGVLRGDASPPASRALLFQAHKGAVQSVENSGRARRKGLLEVGVLQDGRKEVVRLENRTHRVYDLRSDPSESHNLADRKSGASKALASWQHVVEVGLVLADREPTPTLDPETEEQMRALGYLD